MEADLDLAYPRIPYLIPHPDVGSSDQVLSSERIKDLLSTTRLVEEKLDGANVVLWRGESGVDAATRGGPDAMDRAGQLGPLKGWIASHQRQMEAIEPGMSVHCEWLWFTHSLSYDRLPALLVLLDVRAGGRWFDPQQRARFAREGAWSLPPVLHVGPVGDLVELDRWTRQSHCRSGPAEGAVLRSSGEPRLLKWVRPDFRRMTGWNLPHPRNHISPR